MTDTFNPYGTAGALGAADFPDEAFECPNCGQLLAPSCRVCVSCKQTIHPADIRRTSAADLAAAVLTSEPELSPVRFSWRMFFIVLGASWVATTVALHYLGLGEGRIVMSGLQLVTAGWVFLDARQKRLPKPLRWGVGSLILWIVIFPWYLVRRQSPQAPCPFVEAESGPFTRVMLLVVMVFILVAMLVSTFGGLPAK